MAKDVLGFVSQAEYGRHRGVSRKTVTDWKRKGMLVVDAQGRIDVAMTDVVLDERPAAYRGGVTSKPAKRSKGNGLPPARPFEPDPDDDEDLLDGAPVDLSEFGIAQAGDWSLADATRVKEIFLALKRRQDFLAAEGKLVPIEDVAIQIEAEYAVVRERLLSIPGKLADGLVGLDRAAIAVALKREIIEALRELSGAAVGSVATGPAGPAADGSAPGTDATAGPGAGGVV